MKNYVTGLARRAAALRPVQAPRPALGPGALPFAMREAAPQPEMPVRTKAPHPEAPLPAPVRRGDAVLERLREVMLSHAAPAEVPRSVAPQPVQKVEPPGPVAAPPRREVVATNAPAQPPRPVPQPISANAPAPQKQTARVVSGPPVPAREKPAPVFEPRTQSPPQRPVANPTPQTRPQSAPVPQVTQAAAAASRPDIHVRIGRVEIRAVMPPAPAIPQAPVKRSGGFEDLAAARRYLDRNGR